MLNEVKKMFLNNYFNYNCLKVLKLRNRVINTNNKIIKALRMAKYNKLCYKNSVFLPLSAKIGKDIIFPHGLCEIFISSNAIIGDNCTIFQQVTIGSNTLNDSKKKGSPIIGNNVYIGAGAKIIGNVRVGNNVRIGANAVVVKDVPDNSTVVIDNIRIITHKGKRDNRFVTIDKIYSKRSKD